MVRFLINWLINSLLKLRHPAQLDRQGTNLVHIYGPEVHFDRGASLAFNVFDWNGVPVRTDIVQRLADRSNISLGLGTLCNIIYPEGSDDLPVHITFLFPTQSLCMQIKLLLVCFFFAYLLCERSKSIQGVYLHCEYIRVIREASQKLIFW